MEQAARISVTHLFQTTQTRHCRTGVEVPLVYGRANLSRGERPRKVIARP